MSSNECPNLEQPSQYGGVGFSTILREAVDVSQMRAPEGWLRQKQSNLTKNFEDAAQNVVTQTQDLVAEGTEAEVVPKKTRKKKFVFSHRLFMVDKFWFLKVDHFGCLAPDDNTMLVGQVISCPNRMKGENRFGVAWQCDLPPRIKPEWLASEIKSTDEGKKALMDGCNLYDEVKKPAKMPPIPRPGKKASTMRMKATDNVLQTPPPRTVPTHVAAAMLRTLPSVSTMTHSPEEQTAPDLRPMEPVNVETVDSDDEEDLVLCHSTRRTPAASELEEDDWKDVDEISDGKDLDKLENAGIKFPDMVDLPEEDSRDDEVDPNVPSDWKKHPTKIREAIDEIKWSMEEVADGDLVHDDIQPREFNGPKSGLKPHISRQINDPKYNHDPFTVFQMVGGLDDEFVATLANNSNEYFHQELRKDKPRNWKFHGHPWQDITKQDMYRFLGILLKISLAPIDGGGYQAYLQPHDKVVEGMTIPNTKGFAHEIMSLWRFKQIHGAFHPVHRVVGKSGDKAYHSRHAINQFNAKTRGAFNIGLHIVFDEGGVACRSRVCPIRQYNPNKPDKFRVDFFLLCCSATYLIFHLDVYQGKNVFNSRIAPCLRDLPTMQKCVLNALIQCNVKETTQGTRHLAMDNRYACPELLFVMQEFLNIVGTGTCHRRRKGWAKDILTLKKTAKRGAIKFAYNKVQRILLFQWNDNKVVNGCSSVINSSVGTVERQVGSRKITLKCPNVLQRYQRTMFGVDKADQIRMHFGGFASKSHFKKWYKKACMAILDCMLLNSYIAWNQAVESDPKSRQSSLKRYEYYHFVAEQMMRYQDENTTAAAVPLQKRDADLARRENLEHVPQVNPPNKRTDCSVCIMECRWGDLPQVGIRTNLARCSKCGIVTHAIVPKVKNKIHDMEIAKGLTCSQIAHTQEGYQIWQRNGIGRRICYATHNSHPICREIKSMYGDKKSKQTQRKRKRPMEERSDSSDEDAVGKLPRFELDMDEVCQHGKI
jgi:Transposase IS4